MAVVGRGRLGRTIHHSKPVFRCQVPSMKMVYGMTKNWPLYLHVPWYYIMAMDHGSNCAMTNAASNITYNSMLHVRIFYTLTEVCTRSMQAIRSPCSRAVNAHASCPSAILDLGYSNRNTLSCLPATCIGLPDDRPKAVISRLDYRWTCRVDLIIILI
jgi:hypothetical protein